MGVKIDGPFPHIMPEADRWPGLHEGPNHQRNASGGLSDDPSESGNPVQNGPPPQRWKDGEGGA